MPGVIMIEYNIYDKLWELDSTYNWENMTEDFDEEKMKWAYQGSVRFKDGKTTPVWDEV
jgi:hypothetical protein